MPQSPPLIIEGELLAQSIPRGAKESPHRVLIHDLSEGHTITWEQAQDLIHTVIEEWNREGLGDQVLLMGDASWRTAIALLAGHLSGRLLVMADSHNPATYSGDSVSQANLDVVWPDKIASFSNTLSNFQQNYPPLHQWPEEAIARAFLTSGSTGTPKLLGAIAESPMGGWSPLFERGVQAPHYSVLNARRPSTIVYFANLRRAVRSIGTLYLLDLLKDDFTHLDKLLKDVTITEFSITPTMASQIVRSTSGSWKKFVENINLSGEIVSSECMHCLRDSFPHSVIRNNYGMTEIAGTISEILVEPDHPIPDDPVPTGTPSRGLTIHILSDEGHQLAPGVSGRIVVSGLPATKEGRVGDRGRIEFEILHQPGHLETGDIGFLTSDGLLVVEGRWQQMIKIRGERVSLLEVEKAITETGIVSQALAATYTDSKGRNAVGALLVTSNGSIPTIAELRRAISKNHRLIMSPTRIVAVQEIPVLAVGKVDRLRATQLLQEASADKASEVYSAAEMTLSGIVGDVLGIDFVARDEDLFSLGADSLSCLQIIHDIEEIFSKEVDVAFLLQFPTISAIAGALTSGFKQTSRSVKLVPLTKGPTVYWVLPGSNPYMARPIALNMPEVNHVALLHLGSLPGDVVRGDYEQMVLTLRQAILEDDPGHEFFLAGFSSACYLANTLSKSLSDAGRRPAGLIVIDPPTHESIVEEWCTSGKIAHPIHMMTAREGLLSRLDPGTADRALFGLQVFALSRHRPPRIEIPRLFISSSADRLQEPHWAPRNEDMVFIADEQHLDFIRKPSVVVEAVRSWTVMVEALSALTYPTS